MVKLEKNNDKRGGNATHFTFKFVSGTEVKLLEAAL
jgi:hypothetical protein